MSSLMPSYGGVMGQTVVNPQAITGLPGTLRNASSAVVRKPTTFSAAETIFAGLACYTSPSLVTVNGVSSDMVVQLPHTAQGVVTADQNITNGSSTVVVLNGVTMSAIVAASDSAAENLQQIATAILAQPNIASATSNFDSNTITVTATTGNSVVFSSIVTDLGDTEGQSFNWAIASSTLGSFWGIAAYNVSAQNSYSPPGSTGVISGAVLPYRANQPIAVHQFSEICVAPELTNTAGASTPIIVGSSPVYVRVLPTVAYPLVGSFRSDSDGGNAVLVPSNCAQWVVSPQSTQGGVAYINITSVQGG